MNFSGPTIKREMSYGTETYVSCDFYLDERWREEPALFVYEVRELQ